MLDTESFEAVREDLARMEPARVRVPKHLVADTIAEARFVHRIACEDRDLLEGAGLAHGLIESLPTRCGALACANRQWRREKERAEHARAQWDVEARTGRRLRKRLASRYRWFFRGQERLLALVRGAARGRRQADLHQGLYALAALGRRFGHSLRHQGFDLQMLVDAERAAETLRQLYCDTQPGCGAMSPKDARDRAFTYLQEAIEDTQRCGRSVHWGSPARAACYGTRWLRRRIVGARRAGVSPDTVDSTAHSAAA